MANGSDCLRLAPAEGLASAERNRPTSNGAGYSIQSAGIGRIEAKGNNVWRWLIWAAVVIVWTLGLEFPVPKPEHIPAGEFIIERKYIIGKTLHVSAYALLAILSAWVPTPPRYRWLMMFFLMVHAWGSEMLQEALNPWFHRGGSLSDVGFDVVGIVLGLAVSWKWWIAVPDLPRAVEVQPVADEDDTIYVEPRSAGDTGIKE
jgi:hypothetical protein